MSHIFAQESSGERFTAHPLTENRYRISVEGAGEAAQASLSFAPDRGGRPARSGALLLKTASECANGPDGASNWVLIAGSRSRLRINGEARALGIATLSHRDEILLGDAEPAYFSTERLPQVEVYAGDDAPSCPRCVQGISAGDSCVACPACGIRHHEMEARNCWTYGPSCVLCDQPTGLDAELRWSPEHL